MSTLTLFIIATLAVWRDAQMLAEEEGPFGGLARIRDRIDPYQKTWIGRGIRCPLCLSVWCALVVAVWLWYFGYISLPLMPIWLFGMSGGSAALSTIASWMMTRRRNA